MDSPVIPPANVYPDGWQQATRTLWNGAIFAAILLLLCAILVFFFPKEEIQTIHIGVPAEEQMTMTADSAAGITAMPSDQNAFIVQPQPATQTMHTSKSMNIGIGTLLVYFLILTFTALGAINTYQKGLTRFAALFGKDGSRALDVIRWGFMLSIMGVLFHFFIFYLPITDPEIKHQTSTLFIGNSIIILSAITSVVGFLMLATANGCPDHSRKGSLLMIVVSVILLAAAFVAPFAVITGGWSRIVELVLLVGGATLFLIAWRKIIRMVKSVA